MKLWLEAMRPKTLIISVSPILIGTILAYRFHWLVFVMTLICGLGIQIGTNFANDYFDHVHGSDTKKRKGPRRLISAGLISPGAMCFAMSLSFGIAFLAGLYLTVIGGWVIFALLLLAIASGIGYSAGKCSLSRTGLADFFVFIFFGPIAVLATFFLQTHFVEWMPFWASLAPGLIPVAVLTANNLRDRDEDKKCHKKTLTVRFGKRFGQWEYTVCLIGGIVSVVFLLAMKWTLIIALGALIPAAFLVKTVWSFKKSQELIAVLGNTGKVLLLYTLLFCIGALI